MDRRTFLIRAGGTVVGTLVISLASACGSDDDGGTGPDNGNITVEVEFASGHTHSLSLNRNDLTADTATQLTLTGSHDHGLSLTGDEVNQLLAGTTVVKDSTSTNGHVHEVSLAP